MESIINQINDIIWSPALVFLCLGVGLYFSIRTRFMQVRHIGEMFRLMFDGKGSDAGVSSFQALAMSLSGRVGTGNIAGVAAAIAYGGPGAVFWMWMTAFLGAATAYIESTLSQIYKEQNDGLYRGGPAYYIEKGLGWKKYAWVFAIATIISMGFLLPGVQANSIAAGLQNSLGIAPEVSAAIIVVLLGLIIFGGVKRIARFAEIVVPFMALGYILVAGVVIGLNIEKLPGVMHLIISSAFGADAVFGAMLGAAIQWGVKRGVFSNEAGQGSGPHPAAAAEVTHPAKQGIVQAFSVYVDTLFVCSATAFMLLITGLYNVKGVNGDMLVNALPGVSVGPAFTQAAVESVLPGFGSIFVAGALFFFAFTTIVAYYYIAETNVAYINRKVGRPWLVFALKVASLAACLYGAVRSADLAWTLGDIGVGVMAWLNIVAILFLQKPALDSLKDYEAQQAKGLDPAFLTTKTDLPNADLWVGDD
ncbi:alanine/glycine:cation symporter family protein [Uliginosibacterium flavum]|uniref:Alanine/glycine:cation symporter family protein n=1 Tax=Uliginosibacterium flavum TaxID=1396831 RepID=A0ABV2TJD4_9RHOO